MYFHLKVIDVFRLVAVMRLAKCELQVRENEKDIERSCYVKKFNYAEKNE